MKKILTLAAALVAFGLSGARAADQYFSGSGQALDSLSYASGTAGPFSSAFTNGNTLNFWNANGTGTGGTISAVGVTAAESFTLTSAAGTLTLSGSVNVSSGKTLDFGTQLVNGSSLTKAGTGTWVLSGSNAFNGTTSLTAGTLKLMNSQALGATPVIGFSGTSALWLASNAGMTFGGTTNANGNNTIVLDRADPGAAVTHTLATRVNLAGATILSTQAGAQVTSGTAGLNLGSVVLGGSTGTLAPGAGTLLTAASVSTGNAGAAGRSFTVSGDGDMTISGNIATVGTGGGNVTKLGSGKLTLQGGATYTGITAVNDGILRVQSTNATAMGTGSAVLQLGGGDLEIASNSAVNYARNTTVSADTSITLDRTSNGAGVTQTLGTLSIGANELTLSRTAAITSGTAGLTFGTTTLTGAAAFTPGAGTLLTLGAINGVDQSFVVGGAGSVTVSGNIATGNGGITKQGAGLLTLSGSNAYTGATNFNDGVTAISSLNSLGNGGNLNFDGGTLLYAGTSADISVRSVTLGAGGGTIDTNGNDVVFANAIGNGGSGGLAKTGLGKLTLSGSNTYSGPTTITTGALRVTNEGALGSAPVVTFGNAVELEVAGNTGLTFGGTLNAGGSSGSTIVSDRTTAGAGVTHTLGSRVNLGASRTLFIEAGSNVTSGTAGIALGPVAIGNNAAFSAGAGTLLTVASVSTGNSGNSRSFTVTGSGDTVITGNIVTVATSGTDAGAPSNLTKNGSGRLTLSGVAFFTGTTFVNDGILEVASTNVGGLGSGDAVLALAGGNLEFSADNGANYGRDTIVSQNTAVTLNRSTAGAAFTRTLGDLSIGSQLLELVNGGSVTSGISGLVFGTTTLSGDATFNAGVDTRLTLGAVAGNGTMYIAGDGEVVVSGGVDTGAGAVAKGSAGHLTLAGDSTYSGGTTLNAGTLLLSGSSSAGSGSIVLNDGTLTVDVDGGAGAVENAILFSGTSAAYVLERAAGSSFSAYEAASQITGGINTGAGLLAGTASQERTLSASFTTSSAASNDEDRMSNVFSLSGTGTDDFVMQLSVSGLAADAFLAWLNGGLWVNAVMGNSGAGALAGFYNVSFAAFLADNGGSFNGATMLGAYGNDGAGNAWAVLDHNSDFAVIPEPKSLALIGIGLAGLLARVRRRRQAH